MSGDEATLMVSCAVTHAPPYAELLSCAVMLLAAELRMHLSGMKMEEARLVHRMRVANAAAASRACSKHDLSNHECPRVLRGT